MRTLGRMFSSKHEYETAKARQQYVLEVSDRVAENMMAVMLVTDPRLDLPEADKAVLEYELRRDSQALLEMHGVTHAEIDRELMSVIAYGRL